MPSIKPLIARLLCNSLICKALRVWYPESIPNRRYSGLSFEVPEKFVAPPTVAQIFFGFYESAEIRLIESLLPSQNDVVELGASIGIVSSHIARKLNKGKKLIAVEANPKLIPTINRNISKNAATGVEYTVLNRAITIGKDKVHFSFQNNHTANRRLAEHRDDATAVPACSLSHLLNEFCVQRYTLVCDIEGAEIDLLLMDQAAFKKCEAMLIELHNTSAGGITYSVAEMSKILIQDLGFKLRFQEGNVAYFVKTQ